MMSVPRLPDRELLAELCLETAASEGVLPFAVEKDFYDLDQLLRAGKDFESETFRALVDQKLTELRVLPLSEQTSCFAMTPARRRNLDAATSKGL